MKVKVKLILIWLLSLVVMLLLMASVTAYFSWNYHQLEAKERIQHGFNELDRTIHLELNTLKANAKILSEDRQVVAGISMISSYQDINSYQPLIFDVEKRKLASILSSLASASDIDVIALYDGNSRLSSFFIHDDDQEQTHSESFATLPHQRPDEVKYVGYLSYDQGSAKVFISSTIHEPFIESRELPDFFTAKLLQVPVKEPLTRIYDGGEGLVLEMLQPIWRSLPAGERREVGFLRLAKVMDKAFAVKVSKSAALEFSIWLSESRQFGNIQGIDDLNPFLASETVQMELPGVYQHTWVEDVEHFMGISNQQLANGQSVAFIFNVSKQQLQLDMEQVRNAALLVLLFGFILAPFGIYLLNRNISLPISRLTSGVESLSMGSFNRIEGLNEKDEFGYLASAFNNMSDAIQKRGEELKQSEERFSLAMRGANDGLWDWNLLTDEVYYSPRWFTMLGYEPDAFPAVLDTWSRLAHPDDKERFLQHAQDYLEERVDKMEMEMRMKHRDGHDVIVLTRSIKVVRESDGKPIRLVGTHVDITEQKEASIFLSALLDNIGEAMVSCDAQGNLVQFNQAAMQLHGLPAKPIPTEQWAEYYDLYQPDGCTLLRREEIPLFRALQGEHVQNVEMVVAPKNSSPRFLVANGQPLVDSSGQTFGAVVTMHDITERKDLEEQLIQSQKMEAIGTLVGGIAHDFNNTLAGITGNLYLAKKGSKDNSETFKRLETIEDLSFKAAGMIQQLLSFSRKGTFNKKPVTISSFLKEIIKIHRVAIPENIKLIQAIEPSDMEIYADINQIQQVIVNLLNNARDAVCDVQKPEITLQLEKYVADSQFKKSYPEAEGDEFACISVIDNGVGVKEADLEHLFEPFFTTKEVGKGTGLGLSMAYGTVQSHGGVIMLDSAYGKGATFKVYLPLLKETGSLSVDKSEDEIIQGHGETILLVDDNHDVIQIGRDILESIGYKVITALNGLDAVEVYKAQGNSINLILLDLVMPEMGGVEAAKVIRDLNKDAKLIFVTGYDSDQQLNDAENISAKLISKPFKVAELSQGIQAVLKS